MVLPFWSTPAADPRTAEECGLFGLGATDRARAYPGHNNVPGLEEQWPACGTEQGSLVYTRPEWLIGQCSAPPYPRGAVEPVVGWRVVGTMCTCKLPYSLSSVLPALTRREALHLVLGVTLAPTVAGCERVAPFIVSDETVEQLGLETWARLRRADASVTECRSSAAGDRNRKAAPRGRG